VEEWAADAFMFFLTSMLGELESIDAVPVTNEKGALSFAQGTPMRRTAHMLRAVTAREDLLEALLPAPAHAPDVRELLAFKERHSPLMRGFRRDRGGQHHPSEHRRPNPQEATRSPIQGRVRGRSCQDQ
jgi:hypothetical protein